MRFVLLCFFACLLIVFHMERAQDRKEEGKTAEGGAVFSDSNPRFLFYCLSKVLPTSLVSMQA